MNQPIEDRNVPLQDVVNADNDSTEELRRILIKRQHEHITYDEAAEIGDALIEFYHVLAEEVQDDSAS